MVLLYTKNTKKNDIFVAILTMSGFFWSSFKPESKIFHHSVREIKDDWKVVDNAFGQVSDYEDLSKKVLNRKLEDIEKTRDRWKDFERDCDCIIREIDNTLYRLG